MNILTINASPKKLLSNSKYFLTLLKIQLNCCDISSIDKLQRKEYEAIFEQFESIDTLVIALPVYVDAVPSHVLEFMEQAEKEIVKRGCFFRVYIISNCGFYEGNQCQNTLKIMQNWCKRCSLLWQGGIGIGAGEMFGAIRIMPIIAITVPFIQFMLAFVMLLSKGEFSLDKALITVDIFSSFVTLLIFIAFNTSLFILLQKLSNSIKKGHIYEKAYTTVSFCPKFLFRIFANIYWIIRAAFNKVAVWQLYRRIDIDSQN